MNVSSEINEFNRRVMERQPFDALWEDIATFYCPESANMGYNSISNVTDFDRIATMQRRNDKRRVSNGILALQTTASRLYSMMMPTTAYWHDLTTSAAKLNRGMLNIDERSYLEAMRAHLFSYRYKAKAGFVRASKAALVSALAFGVGVFLVEDALSFADAHIAQNAIVTYRFIPMSQIYLGIDEQGNYDRFWRRVILTNREFIQRFGENALSERQKGQRTQNGWEDMKIELIHICKRRIEFKLDLSRNMSINMPFSSVYIDVKDQRKVAEGGYRDFPAIVYTTSDGDDAYGISRCGIALDDVRGMNILKKLAMRAVQQSTDPPLGSVDDTLNRINLNPGAVNPGAIGPQGEKRVQPLHLGGEVTNTIALMEREQKMIDRLLFVDFFEKFDEKMASGNMADIARIQIEMARTIGPIGDSVANGNACLVDRELSILFARGFVQGMALYTDMPAPKSLQGKDITFSSNSPLDRMRDLESVMALQASIPLLRELAAVDPDAVNDKLKVADAAEYVLTKNGVPGVLMRSPEEADARAKARAKAQENANKAAAMEQAAGAVKNVAPALQSMREAGVPVDGMVQGMMGAQQNGGQ